MPKEKKAAAPKKAAPKKAAPKKKSSGMTGIEKRNALMSKICQAEYDAAKKAG